MTVKQDQQAATSDSAKSSAKKQQVTTSDVAPKAEAEQREARAQGVAVSPTSDVPVLYDADHERTAEYVRLVLQVGPQLERISALRDQGVNVDGLDDGEVKDQVRSFEAKL